MTELADWLELEALFSADINSSVQDLTSALRRAGSGEELEDEREIESPADAHTDRGGETLEPVAEDAFAEVEDRAIACAGKYPFALDDSVLQGRPSFRNDLYVFLLALSKHGVGAAPPGLNASQVFEEVAEIAIRNCLGGQRNKVVSYQFGFPRRLAPAGFKAAVDDLCKVLGEGTGSKERPRRKNQKDAKLDLIAWQPFPDGRRGQVMAWGQCATGSDWEEKLTELQPADWAAKWMIERPTVLPLRAFFVPHRVELDAWDESAISGGVLFDRCRIAAFAKPLPAELRKRCHQYSKHVLG